MRHPDGRRRERRPERGQQWRRWEGGAEAEEGWGLLGAGRLGIDQKFRPGTGIFPHTYFC